MNWRIKNVLLAAAVAGATVAPGLAGAAPAAASAGSAGQPLITAVTDTVFAGYVTGGAWRFRFVAASVPVARCRAVRNQNAVARIALKSNIVNQVAQIEVACGGGPGSVRFGTGPGAGRTFSLSPHVGDVLRISIYRNQAAGWDGFVAIDTTSGRAREARVSVPRVIYRHAELGATLVDFSGNWSPPPENTRLWVLRDIAITSYSGTHGIMCGPWPASRHVAAPVISVRLIPGSPWGGCRNFGVLLKGSG